MEDREGKQKKTNRGTLDTEGPSILDFVFAWTRLKQDDDDDNDDDDDAWKFDRTFEGEKGSKIEALDSCAGLHTV